MKQLLLFLLLITANKLYAQTISGTVRDEEGKVLPFTTVTVQDLHKSTTTDAKGYYHIDNIASGNHTMVLSFIGYETENRNVTVNGNLTQDFTLKQTAIDLNETIVLPEGESMSYYLLKQVLDNRKPLKERISSYEGDANCRIQSLSDLRVFPKSMLAPLHFIMSLAGYNKILRCMENHIGLRVEMARDVKYSNGKISSSDTKITSYEPDSLTEAELASFQRKAWDMDKNPYDELYDEMETLKKLVDKYRQKNKDLPMDSLMTYDGCYDEGGRIIHVIKTKLREIHIVSGLWQIRRFTMDDGGTKDYYECQQIASGAYLPVSCYHELYNDFSEGFDKEAGTDLTEEQLKEKMHEKIDKIDTSEMSKRKQKKVEKYHDMVDRLAANPRWSFVFSTTYNYDNVVAK